MDSVDRISVDAFTDKYAYTSRPVVVRNAMKDWNASKVFDFSFFRHLYLERFPGSVDVLDEHCQFFNYKTEFRSLRELLTMSPKRFEEMWYVGWSNCDVSVADVLRQHYSRPTFLPLGSESSRLDWIFMGRPGYGANMHVGENLQEIRTDTKLNRVFFNLFLVFFLFYSRLTTWGDLRGKRRFEGPKYGPLNRRENVTSPANH